MNLTLKSHLNGKLSLNNYKNCKRDLRKVVSTKNTLLNSKDLISKVTSKKASFKKKKQLKTSRTEK